MVKDDKHSDPLVIDDEKLQAKLKMLLNMRVFEHDIIYNKEYCDRFYSTYDQVRNNGYLTLVKPKYARLFLRMLAMIARESSVEKILARGNEAAKSVTNALQQDATLKNGFLRDWKKVKVLTEEEKVDFINSIIRKVKNPRFGDSFKRTRSKTIGRGSKNENSTAFRVSLKEATSKNKRKKMESTD